MIPTLNEMNFIDHLPDELLNNIFSYLSFSEVKTNVALVSKRWYELSQYPHTTTCLTFGPQQDLQCVLSTLRLCPSLSSLTIHSRRDLEDILLVIVECSTKLTYLNIHATRDTRPVDLRADLIIDVLRSCKGLKHLTLKRANIDLPDIFFNGIVQHGHNLKKINLNHSLQLGTDELKLLVSAVSNVVDLRIYCLSFNSIGSLQPYSDEPVVTLARKFHETLTVLKLNMLGLSNDVMPCIAQCVHLTVLHMYRVLSIYDDGIILLGGLSLKQLVVTVPRVITSQAWMTLFSQQNLRNIESLNISNSDSIDDNVIRIISENGQKMKSLSFPGCRKISSEGVSSIIRSCHDLTYLNLYSTKGAVASAFSLIPQHLPSLKTLVFRPVDVQSPEITNIIGENLDNLQVISVYRYV